MKRTDIRCHHCDQTISRRSDLLVVGRTLIPLHVGCIEGFHASQPASLRSWPINRLSSWIRFNAWIIGAATLGSLLLPEPSRILEAWPILAVANGGLLVARFTSWMTLERHLQ